MFYKLEWIFQHSMVMLTTGGADSPIRRPKLIAELRFVGAFQL